MKKKDLKYSAADMRVETVIFCKKEKTDIMQIKNTVLLFCLLILLSGCGVSKDQGEKLSEEQTRRSIFWQFSQPKMQMDPIQQNEMPDAFYPLKQPEEKGK